MSRLASMVVRLALDMVGYKADLDKAATDTTNATNQIERGAGKAGGGLTRMGGAMGGAADAAVGLASSAGLAGQAAAELARGVSVAAAAAHEGSKAEKDYQQALLITGQVSKTMAGQVRSMAAGVASVATAVAVVQMADAVTTLNTQLTLASGSTGKAVQAYEELFQIAQKSRVNFTELGSTYAAIARAGNEMGVSQERLLGVTQSISQAMTIGGGSAVSMQAALIQLGQGLSSGTLRGEELNSIMEQTPRLAKAIADGLGIPIGELRALGEAGQLTGQQVITALEKSGPQLAKEMASATLTVGQAFTMLGNSSTQLIGTMDAATGTSAAMARAVQGLSTGLDKVGTVIKEHETAFAVITGGIAAASTVAGVIALSGALSAAVPAVLAFGAAWLATPLGPVILAIAAVAAGITGLKVAADAAAKSEKGLGYELAFLDEKITRLEASRESATEAGIKRLDALRGARAKLNAELAVLSNQGLDTRAEDARLGRSTALFKEREKISKEYQAIKQDLAGINKDFQAHLEQLQAARAQGLISEKQYVADVHALLAKEGGIRKSTNSDTADAMEVYNALVAKASGYSADYAEKTAALTSLVGKKKISVSELSEAMAVLNAQQPGAIALEKQRLEMAKLNTKAVDDYFDAQEKLRLANEAQIKTARTTLDQIEFETKLLGLNAEQRALATMERDLERQGIVKGTQAYDAYIERLRIAVSLRSDKQAEVDAAKASSDEWKKGLDETLRLGRDVFNTLGNDGVNMAQKVGDALGTAVKSALFDLFAKPVMVQVYSAIAGTDPAGRGGASGGLGSLGKEIAGSFADTIAKTGLFGTEGQDAYLNALNDGVDAATAQKLATAANTDAMKSMATELGTFGAVLGIEKFILQAIGGTGGIEHFSSLKGNFSDAGFSGGNLLETKAVSGGPFGGIEVHGYANSPLERAQQDYLDLTYQNILKQTQGFAQAMGYPASVISGYSKDINLYFTGDKTANQQAIKDMFTNIGNEMALSVLKSGSTAPGGIGPTRPDYSYLIRPGEDASGTLARLGESITAVNGAFDNLHTTFMEVSIAGAASASNLIDAFGGLQAFTQQTSSYYSNFYSKAEQEANTKRQLTSQLATLGLDLPATREAYRQMVDDAAKALGTSTGDATYATLIKLSDAFASIVPAADAAGNSVDQAAQKLASTNASLQDKLDLLTGAKTQRDLELRDATDESTKALLRQIYAQEDLNAAAMATAEASKAAEQALVALTNANKAWQDKLDIANGTRTARQVQLANDLAAATDDSTRALIMQVYAQEDLNTATTAAAEASKAATEKLKAGVNTALDGVKRSVDAARKAEQASYESQATAIKASLSSVGASIGKLQSLSNTLASTLDGMRIAGSDMDYRKAAQAQISAALATARAGGALPLDGQLNSALATVAKPSEALYATFEEYATDFYKTANDISSLNDLTKTSLTADQITQDLLQKQLDTLDASHVAAQASLDGILTSAQDQVDAINGVDNSVKSIADALLALSGSIAAYKTGTVAGAGATTTAVGGSTSMLDTSGLASVKPADWPAGVPFYAEQAGAGGLLQHARTNLAGMSQENIARFIGEAMVHGDGGTFAPAGDFKASDVLAAIQSSIAGGYSAADVLKGGAANFGIAAGDITAIARQAGIPGFAVGTNYVPQDMLAVLHQGEEITPAAYNPAAGGRTGDPRVAALLERLIKEVAFLRETNTSGLRSIAFHASETTDQLSTQNTIGVLTRTS